MNENKTQPTATSFEDFLDTLEDEQKRQDSIALDKMFREITGEKPVLWGPSIVGYGSYHYKTKSGREGDFLKIGFSPRKRNLSLYIMLGFDDYASLLEKMGKYSTGKSCLYIKKLDDVDKRVLTEIAKRGWQDINRMYP